MELKNLLRPSAAHRWLQCTGSIELIQKLSPDYLDSLTNEAAKEGQRLHRIASDILESIGALQKHGVTLPFKQALESVSDEDKVLIQPYVDYVSFEMGKQCTYFIETTMNSYDYNIQGTPDFISTHLCETNRCYATVVDLKTGRIPVNVVDNVQLKMYALLFIKNFSPHRHLPSFINFVIVQPKCEGITEHQITYTELMEWEQTTLLPALRAIDNKQYTYKTGDHCKYCPALSICPKVADEFKTIEKRSAELISVENLDYLFWVTEKEKEITQYLKTVKDFLVHGLKKGSIKSDMYMLARKYGNTQWRQDDIVVTDWLTKRGVDPFEKKLKSPTKVSRELEESVPEEFVERKCIGYKIENAQVAASKVFTKVEEKP